MKNQTIAALGALIAQIADGKVEVLSASVDVHSNTTVHRSLSDPYERIIRTGPTTRTLTLTVKE